MPTDDQYDEYDDDELIDDSDAYVRSTNSYVGDAEALLRRALDIIATAPTMPLSSSPRIDRDEIIELLEESLHRLPEEMRQARWMIKERQEFVTKTRREADELLEAARVQAERMVQRTEVVRAAELRARQVSEAADADADYSYGRWARIGTIRDIVSTPPASLLWKLQCRGQLLPSCAALSQHDCGYSARCRAVWS